MHSTASTQCSDLHLDLVPVCCADKDRSVAENWFHCIIRYMWPIKRPLCVTCDWKLPGLLLLVARFLLDSANSWSCAKMSVAFLLSVQRWFYYYLLKLQQPWQLHWCFGIEWRCTNPLFFFFFLVRYISADIRSWSQHKLYLFEYFYSSRTWVSNIWKPDRPVGVPTQKSNLFLERLVTFLIYKNVFVAL